MLADRGREHLVLVSGDGHVVTAANAYPVALAVGYSGARTGQAEAEDRRRVNWAEMRSPVRQHLLKPAIFGLSDGMMSLLGVVLYLLGHQSLVFPAALSGAISSALSMAGGEWLSESDSGLGASLVMGAATGLGGVLPALPFAFASGRMALGFMVLISMGIGALVALMRTGRSRVRAFTETAAVLATIFLAVLLCGLFLPGSAA